MLCSQERSPKTSSEVSYLVSEATGPYFRESPTSAIKTSILPYSIQCDETTNSKKQNKNKQLDTVIRYWSAQQHIAVVHHHLRTYVMGHARGKELAPEIQWAIEEANMPFSSLLMLGSGGPNVNTYRTVWNCLNDAGPGNLHICHNGFAKGLKA